MSKYTINSFPYIHWDQFVGPTPPESFEGNGTTCWFDTALWQPAVLIHDYEYKLAGEIMAQARSYKGSYLGNRKPRDMVEYLRLRSKATHARYTADINLGQNIKLCALMRYTGWRAVLLYMPVCLIAKTYRKVTRTFGFLFAY